MSHQDLLDGAGKQTGTIFRMRNQTGCTRGEVASRTSRLNVATADTCSALDEAIGRRRRVRLSGPSKPKRRIVSAARGIRVAPSASGRPRGPVHQRGGGHVN